MLSRFLAEQRDIFYNNDIVSDIDYWRSIMANLDMYRPFLLGNEDAFKVVMDNAAGFVKNISDECRLINARLLTVADLDKLDQAIMGLGRRLDIYSSHTNMPQFGEVIRGLTLTSFGISEDGVDRGLGTDLRSRAWEQMLNEVTSFLPPDTVTSFRLHAPNLTRYVLSDAFLGFAEHLKTLVWNTRSIPDQLLGLENITSLDLSGGDAAEFVPRLYSIGMPLFDNLERFDFTGGIIGMSTADVCVQIMDRHKTNKLRSLGVQVSEPQSLINILERLPNLEELRLGISESNNGQDLKYDRSINQTVKKLGLAFWPKNRLSRDNFERFLVLFLGLEHVTFKNGVCDLFKLMERNQNLTSLKLVGENLLGQFTLNQDKPNLPLTKLELVDCSDGDIKLLNDLVPALNNLTDLRIVMPTTTTATSTLLNKLIWLLHNQSIRRNEVIRLNLEGETLKWLQLHVPLNSMPMLKVYFY